MRQSELSQWVQLRSYELAEDVPLFWEAHESSQHLWPLLVPEGIFLAAARDQGSFSEDLGDWLLMDCNKGPDTARFVSGLYGNLGAYYATQKQTDKALHAWREAIAIDPLSPSPWSNQGTILSRRGDFSKATAMFLQALRLDPYHHDAAVNLAIVRATQGELGDAERWARRAKRSDPNREEANKVLDHIRKSRPVSPQ